VYQRGEDGERYGKEGKKKKKKKQPEKKNKLPREAEERINTIKIGKETCNIQ